jgi:hypothetical protein
VGDDDTPMWVTVETSTGVGRSKLVFIPLARLKQEGDEIRTPYSFDHIQEAPEVEAGDELSEEDDFALRGYYGIGLADQEMVDAAQSYASQVPDEEEPARKVDAGNVEGRVREIDDRPPGERAREADDAEKDGQDEDEDRKGRKATAEDILGDDGDSGDESRDEDRDDSKDGEDE